MPTARGGRKLKVHDAPNFVQEELANPGPWIGVASSRCTDIRYDYGLRAVFVRFPNGITYVYESVQLAVFHNFRRSASKGKFISRVLNTYPYRVASPEEASRPTTHFSPTGE